MKCDRRREESSSSFSLIYNFLVEISQYNQIELVQVDLFQFTAAAEHREEKK